MRLHIPVLATLLVAFGCGRASAPGYTKEAPDAFNTVDSFGIFKVYNYETLQTNTKLVLPQVPWTDIYWPTEEAGLANRWTDEINPAATTSPEEIALGDFLKRYAGELGKPQPDPLLSPAEKYDIVFQFRHNLELPADKLLALSTEISKQDAAIHAQTAIPAKLPLLQTMYNTFLSDDNLKLDRAMSMTVNGWASFLDGNLNPKNRWLSDEKNPGDDWSWEGHCHGWAVAANQTLPPKHGVMATIGDKQVFFSEGDLRGLMTKAWADAAPDDGQYFLGRRCYEGTTDAAIPSNANGRGYAGHLQLTKTSPVIAITVLDTLPRLMPVKLHGRDRHLTVYQIRYETTGERKYLVENVVGNGDPDSSEPDEYWLADSFSDLTQALKAKNPLDQLTQPFSAQLTGCWDVNPASFHQVLVEQLSQRKIGFVMNRTRVAQVWNQPIYSANFNIGELVKVGDQPDLAAKYRASGTTYLAQVHADVSYTDEPENPELTYEAGYDLDSQTVQGYDYTLEFDAEKRLIGGEWGTFGKIDPVAPSPDFLMGYPQGTAPVDLLDKNSDFANASIDYSGIIGKLHDCGMSDKIDGQLTVLGKQLVYSNCVIDKAAE